MEFSGDLESCRGGITMVTAANQAETWKDKFRFPVTSTEAFKCEDSHT